MATSGKQPRSSYFSPVELEILMTAYAETNRKKAEARKTGGGPPPPPLTEAEKMALSQNSGRPIAEGISGGSSSDPPTPQVTGAYIREPCWKLQWGRRSINLHSTAYLMSQVVVSLWARLRVRCPLKQAFGQFGAS
ncbi:unnamed protein product [Pleuronectes platessa]|uniref:Uncharacterized protein n=1 Tax=Pleuronectes platessa TaxID=8262 RepID=A0A9N7Z833_PLEPL|nr:unnamed protein product [Pleuronectes platessa]